MNVYEKQSIARRVAGNPYVGRGIAAGLSESGKKAAFACFIMGRSVNSRNRVFVRTGDGVRTQAHRPELLSDPSLILYNAVRKTGSFLVVANGDQTDTIVQALEQGGDMVSALTQRTFEPDGPHFTPRISALLCLRPRFCYQMSILKSLDEAGAACTRQFFFYEAVPGLGHFLHTYAGDGEPLPSFVGEPERVSVPDSIDMWTEGIWNSLDAGNKISLYVSMTDLDSGEEDYRMVNRNE